MTAASEDAKDVEEEKRIEEAQCWESATASGDGRQDQD